jgi:DnaJ-class molecular chaperone
MIDDEQPERGNIMTDKYERCPENCSSSGEVWNGESLVLCSTCKGNTVVLVGEITPKHQQAECGYCKGGTDENVAYCPVCEGSGVEPE